MWWSSTQVLLFFALLSFLLNCFVLINYDNFDPLGAMGRSAVWSLKKKKGLIWFCYVALLLTNESERYSTSDSVYNVIPFKKSLQNNVSVIFAQSELLLEKLIIDAMKSFNFGYELMKYVNINRLLLENNQLYSDRQCL